MNKRLFVGAFALLVLVGAGCMGMGSDERFVPADLTSEGTLVASDSAEFKEVREFKIDGGDMYFTPNGMIVKKGDRVRIIYKNLEGTHDLKIDEFGVYTPILAARNQETTVEFTADKAGSFEYYCSVEGHRVDGMWGTLVVE